MLLLVHTGQWPEISSEFTFLFLIQWTSISRYVFYLKTLEKRCPHAKVSILLLDFQLYLICKVIIIMQFHKMTKLRNICQLLVKLSLRKQIELLILCLNYKMIITKQIQLKLGIWKYHALNNCNIRSTKIRKLKSTINSSL